VEKLLINADDFVGTRELRAHLTNIIEDIRENDRTIVVTVQGKPAGVLLSVSGYTSLLEEIDELQDAALLASIAEARAEISAGKGVGLDQALRNRKGKAPATNKSKSKKKVA
jgi:prevent-host-death family protein